MIDYETVENRVKRNVSKLFIDEPEEFTIDHLAGYQFSVEDVKQAKRELKEWNETREKHVQSNERMSPQSGR